MSSGVGAPTRTRDPAVVVGSLDVAVPSELVAQHADEPRLDQHGRPGPRAPLAPPRRRPAAHAAPARNRRAARRAGRSPRPSMIRSTRKVRCPLSVPAMRYQMSSLSTRPHGSTSRSVRSPGAVRRRPAGPCGAGPRRSCSRSTSSGRRPSRSPQRADRPRRRRPPPRRRPGRSAGSARTSLRSAAFASPEAAAAGPASRNSACASVADSPLRSVRAPPTSDQPPPRPGLRVDRDARRRQRLQVAAGGRHATPPARRPARRRSPGRGPA